MGKYIDKVARITVSIQKQRIKELESALSDLLDSYLQRTSNACNCDEYNGSDVEDEDTRCPYCYAKDTLSNKLK